MEDQDLGFELKIGAANLVTVNKQQDEPFKPEDDKAEVEGYITTFGNEDVVGDIIAAGALNEFVTRFNAGEVMLRMLFQHNRSEIIGQWTELRIDERGVYAVGEIFLEVSRGLDVANLIRRGVLDSFSIGFIGREFERNANGGRTFTRIDLVETSVVDVPANPQAKITEIKNEEGLIDVKELKQLMRNAGMSRKEIDALMNGGFSELKLMRNADARELEMKAIVQQLTKSGG